MEFLFALAVLCLAAIGLGLGLLFGGTPVRTSCGATERLEKDRCSDCPLRGRVSGKEEA